jgi:hypothetical protein
MTDGKFIYLCLEALGPPVYHCRFTRVPLLLVIVTVQQQKTRLQHACCTVASTRLFWTMLYFSKIHNILDAS